MDGGSSKQQATASGDGAVVSQIDGSNNVVTIFARGSQMVLDRPHRRRREPTTELELLQTEVRATRLVGRDTELTALKDWLAQDAAVAVRCLVGRAGSGKSRLAIELCEAAEADEWIAGFVDSYELLRFHAQMNLSASQPVKQSLVVVDDAATAGRILKDWFTALARQARDSGAGKLRVLMLERQADTEFGWWAELKRVDDIARAGAAAIIGREQPVTLSVLAEVKDRRALLEDAMALAAQLKGVSVPALPIEGANTQFDALLKNDSRLENEPLFLMMAAIVGVERGAPGALSLGKPELARLLAFNERRRLLTLAEATGLGGSTDLLLHAAACITLQRGCTGEALMAMLTEEVLAMGFGPAPPALATLLREAMPQSGEMVDGIRPDLIGGAFMADIVKGAWPRGPSECHAIIARAKARASQPVIETLVLAVQDLAEGRADFPAVQWVLAVARAEPNADRLAETIDRLPENSLALREAAAELQERLTDLRRLEDNPVGLAASLNNLANRQSALGQREAALATAEEAVMLRRQLAAARPDAFLPDLAGSLNNLAGFQSALGQREAALATAEEAVKLRRQLAAARPDAFLPNLAGSLNNLASFQSDLGQREAALATAEEAVKLRRQLAAARPDAFLPNLAGSLNNLASFQSDLGQREAALATAEEAVKLYRQLAAARPDAFLPNLAGSLNNLASFQSDLGQREAALATAEEAVKLYRQLAAARPDAFLPDLAGSLNNLAGFQSALGQREAALATAEEAVKLRRQLAAARPDAFLPDLATSLSVLADMLEGQDALEAACQRDREAVATLSSPFMKLPTAHARMMITILKDYLRRHEAAGREPDADLLQPIIEQLNRM